MEDTNEISETRTEILAIRLKPSEAKDWENAAQADERDVSSFVRAIINKHLRNQKED